MPNSFRRSSASFLWVAIAILAGVPLAAHDMWIEPTAFVADASKVLGVRLRVGENLSGSPLPRDPLLIDQFVVVDAAGRRPIVGREASDPAGLLRLGAGLSVLGYSSHPRPITLDADKFDQYLAEEGLDAVRQERVRRKQDRVAGREVFSRCAKSLVLSGPANTAQRDRALGFTLELVAEANPYVLGANGELPVQLLFRGQPLAGARVAAINRENPAAKVSLRTDASGRARLRLPQRGLWLIKAVHMVPADASAGADWASFWASLTFELPDANFNSVAQLSR